MAELKQVVSIDSKKVDGLVGIRSQMGFIVAKEAAESDDTCLFVEAVEMLQVQTQQGMGIIGTYIGKLVALPGNEEQNDYFVFDVLPKSPYAEEHKRVMRMINLEASRIIQ